MPDRTRTSGALAIAAVAGALAALPVPVLADHPLPEGPLRALEPAAAAPADAAAIEKLVARKAAILDLLHKKAEKALVTSAQDETFAEYFRATSPDERARLKERIDQISLNVQRRFQCEEMCLIDPTGSEVSRIVGNEIAHDLSDEEAEAIFFAPGFRQEPRTVYVSPVYMSPDADKWVLAYVTPIVVDGETRAILHYEHNLEAYQDALAGGMAGDDPFVVAVTPDGWVVGDSRKDIAIEKRGGSDEPGDYFEWFEWHGLGLDELKQEIGAEGDRGSGGVTVNGETYRVAYQTLGGWTLVGIDKE